MSTKTMAENWLLSIGGKTFNWAHVLLENFVNSGILSDLPISESSCYNYVISTYTLHDVVFSSALLALLATWRGF